MQAARKLLAVVVPSALAVAALLHAHAIASLIESIAYAPPYPVVPVASARSASLAGDAMATRSAAPILARNPFDHATGPLLEEPPSWRKAQPECSGVRALVVASSEEQAASVAALDVGGMRVLRRRGGEAGGMRVAWIGADRVWLSRADGHSCEAPVFRTVRPEPKGSGGIERSSAGEVHVDRATLERLLDAPAALGTVRIVPEANGVRIAKLAPGSAIALLGIEEGDRLVSAAGVDVTSTEKVFELYARLRSGMIDRMPIVLVRRGNLVTMEYVVR